MAKCLRLVQCEHLDILGSSLVRIIITLIDDCCLLALGPAGCEDVAVKTRIPPSSSVVFQFFM